MDAQRPGETISDRDIDRALAAALAVEPSADFLARVRLRVAAEADPPSWRPSWMVAAAGLAATAIVVAIALTQMNLTAIPPDPDRALPVPSFARGSSEKPTPEMRAVMNSNAEANAAIKAHLRDKNYEAIVKDAATYAGNFAYIETFWARKNVAGALAISRLGLQAAASLEAAALAKDAAAVEKAIAVIIGTCETCHKEYREQLPDNTYAIRL